MRRWLIKFPKFRRRLSEKKQKKEKKWRHLRACPSIYGRDFVSSFPRISSILYYLLPRIYIAQAHNVWETASPKKPQNYILYSFEAACDISALAQSTLYSYEVVVLPSLSLSLSTRRVDPKPASPCQRRPFFLSLFIFFFFFSSSSNAREITQCGGAVRESWCQGEKRDALLLSHLLPRFSRGVYPAARCTRPRPFLVALRAVTFLSVSRLGFLSRARLMLCVWE